MVNFNILFQLSRGTFNWISKKQRLVALSSPKFECMALTNASSKVV